MSMQALAPFNVQELTNMDDALAMLDANIEDLINMVGNQKFTPKETWYLEKNVLFLKQYYDRIEELIKGEE